MPPKKTLDEKYQSMDQKEHILKRPGMYMGDIHLDMHNVHIIEHNWTDSLVTKSKKHHPDPEEKPSMAKQSPRSCIIEKSIELVPGFMSIVEEVLINANDQKYRLEQAIQAGEKLYPVTEIYITVDQATGRITVKNDGEGIDVDKHPKTGLYIPEMIFSELLTSTNYDDTGERVTGGQNGIGVKLTNLYSTEFTIETIDAHRKLRYMQTFYNNMSRRDDPIITKLARKTAPYTLVSFIPDYARFKMKSGLTADLMKLIEKRAYDLFISSNGNVAIYFNGVRIKVTNFEEYMRLYLDVDYQTFITAPNERWTIGVCLSPTYSFRHISFVNGIFTSRGGKHVDYIAKQFVKKLNAHIYKKRKVEVKDTFIKENLMLFINCVISNPTFDSQTKETLTSNQKDFGTTCDIGDTFIEQYAAESGIIDRVIALNEFQDSQILKRTDGKKVKRLYDIEKLIDAHLAGTKHSKDCILILTEGDSAKAMAFQGVSAIPNASDYYGIFPLRGKLLNTRDVTERAIAMNAEICNLKRILGLQEDAEYTTAAALRYGHIMIMTDADHDGSHIKGLIMNFLAKWPSLLKIEGFITAFSTPIIKALRAKPVAERVFYTMKEFADWQQTAEANKTGWTIKYYKGLASSSNTEAKVYFTQYYNTLTYIWTDISEATLDMAFNKERPHDRKIWLGAYSEQLELDVRFTEQVRNNKLVTYEDFINKELIHFSNYDNMRSIPNLCDGMKPSQRKILYACFKRNLVSEIKVAQLAGYVGEHSAYHHGDASLHGTIIKMAQNFVGSNNINLLMPCGQFGSRGEGGNDSGAPRYITTYLTPITHTLFNKQDFRLHKYCTDDGYQIEPQYYVPIMPMILINGCDGIGTGWMTKIPQFNPLDILTNIYNIMDNKPLNELAPWYLGFTGTIKRIAANKWISKGAYNIVDKSTVEITELPIGMWTDKYRAFLNSMLQEDSKASTPSILREYKESFSGNAIHFELQLNTDYMADALDATTDSGKRGGITVFEKMFKLTSAISCVNTINVYNHECRLMHYTTVEDVLRDFYIIRLELYGERHRHLTANMRAELRMISVKAQFILDVNNKRIAINNVAKADLIAQLERLEYPKMNTQTDTLVEPTDPDYQTARTSYNYLIQMPMYNLTRDKVEELLLEKGNIEHALAVLQSKTPKDLWKDDLHEFEAEYARFMDAYYEEIEAKPPAKKQKKKIAIKTR
jgi:DNA topoisomerase II